MKKRTTDLFRFATLRAPELISEYRKKLGFIKHPNVTTSTFLKNLSAGKVSTFNPFQTVDKIKTVTAEMFEFATWLNNNKFEFERSDLKEVIPSRGINAKVLLVIWDNVYHDILTGRNPYIRQACLQLIVANNFRNLYKEFSPGVTKDKDEQDKELENLRRLANAKIVIDEIVNVGYGDSVGQAKVAAPNISNRSSRKQEVRHTSKMAELRIPELQMMEKELMALEKSYNAECEASFDKARISYEQIVEKAVFAFFEKNPDLKDKPEVEYELPEGLVEEFSFECPNPLSPGYLLKRVSIATSTYIDEKCLSNGSIGDALESLQKDIQDLRKNASLAVQKKYKSIAVNGFILSSKTNKNYEFGLSFQKSDSRIGGSTAFFSLNAGYDNAFVKSGSFNLTIDGQPYDESAPVHVSSKNGTVLLELFGLRKGQAAAKIPAPNLTVPEGKLFELEGFIELDNGDRLMIRKTGNTSIEVSSGYPILIQDVRGNAEFYGVQRLGIADYRKVEQELCCYIPGEVSHIENILAREYKERSTRQLTRTESTIESTNERELEETSDTTSSTRHEMSSEVAEVINKDRSANLGYNAETGGKILGNEFSFGTSGDFSWGQSSSDSNLMAKTYAEDVTRRALERIVQKTTLKRTSKILKEFEDNNKHGYDNRKGKEHVTGVFRWIDKLYKNRIVNYGKRLMYEFMIPEPSRFYRDLMFSEAEDGDTTGSNTGETNPNLPVEPVHPSVHGITGASSIQRDTYSNYSSLYGVNPVGPLEEFSNISDSYSESIGGTDKPKSFNYYNLRVPDNYQCFQINGSTNLAYTARTGAKAYMVVNTASKSKRFGDYRGKGTKSGSWTHTIGNIEGQIAVSVNTKKITSFSLTVEVKCRLKSSIFEQWQQDIYNDIMTAYNQQLQAYQDALALEEANNEIVNAAEEETPQGINPRFGHEIITTEIKRLCIEMLMAPFNIPQGADFYENGDGECKVPNIKLGTNLDLYSSRVKFFEQAFDWSILSHIFYPYYWADKCKWKDLIQLEGGSDHIFQAFLKSGMGRVIVPVRQGFEDAVTFYMKTGKIWNGTGIVLNTDNELYLSIVDELTQVGGYVEGVEWETIVPSSLTIVQAKSALLEEEGLPCCETDEEVLRELTLKGDDNILELIEG